MVSRDSLFKRGNIVNDGLGSEGYGLGKTSEGIGYAKEGCNI